MSSDGKDRRKQLLSESESLSRSLSLPMSDSDSESHGPIGYRTRLELAGLSVSQKTFNTPLKSDIYLKLRLSRYLSFRDQDMYDYRRQPCRPNSIICKPRVLSNEFADSSSLCRPSTFIIENSEAALAESPIEMSYKAPCSKVYDIKASGRG